MYFFFLVFTFLSSHFDLFASNPVNNPVLENESKKNLNQGQNESSLEDPLSKKLLFLTITKPCLEYPENSKVLNSNKRKKEPIIIERQHTPEFSPSHDQKLKKTKTKLEIIPINLAQNDF